jgi:WhiB family redox-sensing transcriptional regulator
MASLSPSIPHVELPDFGREAPCIAHPEPYLRLGTATDEKDREREVKAAKASCRNCPAANACLLWALTNPQLTKFGVWAATTPRQRQRLRERLAKRLGPDWARLLQRKQHQAVRGTASTTPGRNYAASLTSAPARRAA